VRFASAAHDSRVTARLGLALGIAFGLCFLTGLWSHWGQHTPGWLTWPTRPVNLYRVTQGVHVLSGFAAVPLLLAKLWSAYPKLFDRPVLRSLSHGAERLALLVLLAAAFFELATGVFNVAQSYPWRFFFPTAHYAVAWIAIGALLVHIGAKLPVIQVALRDRLGREPAPKGAALTRRGFLRTAFGAAGVVVLATAGVTVPGLRRVPGLNWVSDRGAQRLPVNRTAAAAGIRPVGPDWRLSVIWPGGQAAFTLAQLAELPQQTVSLPISCVEGWSADATWTGVRIRDLLAAAGAPATRPVRVESLERGGLYATSLLPARHVRDPLTLLALRLHGEPLAADHGYPCRIIAPDRPGVLQTKWVSRLEVRP
jgi:DMSO/TMAO reductase YedYZ molybdopterin-dependent catalytic subunit